MPLESGDDIESSGMSGSAEAPSEKSEKQREASKKAQSQLQKTQKDEKKAKGDNNALFQILTHFIQNPFYEELVPVVVQLLEIGFSSRYILTLVSLVYPDAAVYVFSAVGSHEKALKITKLHRYDTQTEFHEDNIDSSIREWMSLWINASEKFLTLPEVSVIITQKLSILLQGPEYNTAILASEKFFRFFFLSRNILLQEKHARQYARFIIHTILQAINKTLLGSDVELRLQSNLDANDLFGI